MPTHLLSYLPNTSTLHIYGRIRRDGLMKLLSVRWIPPAQAPAPSYKLTKVKRPYRFTPCLEAVVPCPTVQQK